MIFLNWIPRDKVMSAKKPYTDTNVWFIFMVLSWLFINLQGLNHKELGFSWKMARTGSHFLQRPINYALAKITRPGLADENWMWIGLSIEVSDNQNWKWVKSGQIQCIKVIYSTTIGWTTFLRLCTRPQAQRRVTQPRKRFTADLCS